MMRNMATSLFLTVREKEDRIHRTDEDGHRLPEDGRIRTTLQKAKEVRALVEKCITIAVRSQAAMKHSNDLLPAEHRPEKQPRPNPNAPVATWTDELRAQRRAWLDARREWRESEQGQQWAEARAPVVAAQRRIMQLLGNKRKLKRLPALTDAKKRNGKLRQRGRTNSFFMLTPERQAVNILFHILGKRFEDRPGGYTRILRLAKPRLGDAGTRAILEIITPTPDGSRPDRHKRVRAAAEKPDFDGAAENEDKPDWVSDEEVAASNEAATSGEADWIADEAAADTEAATDEAVPDTEAAAEDDQADDNEQDAK